MDVQRPASWACPLECSEVWLNPGYDLGLHRLELLLRLNAPVMHVRTGPGDTARCPALFRGVQLSASPSTRLIRSASLDAYSRSPLGDHPFGYYFVNRP
jgi:hypothetical protein